MLRKIIEIDEDRCDGCGLCIPACPEGAIQLIDGKAKLVRDFYCDGLGACLGHCPQGAITVIEREADAYDEHKVMDNVIAQGDQVVQQHLQHLREHGETHYLNQALTILKENQEHKTGLELLQTRSACPGSQSFAFDRPMEVSSAEVAQISSSLSHWPVQMHLISPMATHYRDSEVVLAADCVAFSMANFHQNYLKGKTLAIACPKLDQNQRVYLEKLILLIDNAKIKTLNVMIMQVPCCSGLLQLAKSALQQAQRTIPLKASVVSIRGEILKEFEE
jgi:NAD-dependent dihydropyrimidine dehydrogenase PreA subunit